MPWSPEAKKGESGFADKYRLTIAKAHYGFPFVASAENPNAGNACNLILDGEMNVDGDLRDTHLWLGCGDFEPGDAAGTFALHSTQDANRHFSQNSKLGKFIKSALECDVPLEGNQAADRAQYEEKDALIWEGMILDIEEVATSGKNRKTGKEWSGRQPLVRAFVGMADGSTTTATTTSSTTTTASASTNGSKTDAAALLAKASDSYLKYLESVTSQLGVDPGDELAQQAFYESSRT